MKKCSKCDFANSDVVLKDVRVKTPNGIIWKGVAYTCPICDFVFSVTVHPDKLTRDVVISLKTELNDIRQQLDALKTQVVTSVQNLPHS